MSKVAAMTPERINMRIVASSSHGRSGFPFNKSLEKPTVPARRCRVLAASVKSTYCRIMLDRVTIAESGVTR
jgi:hypothetical protein